MTNVPNLLLSNSNSGASTDVCTVYSKRLMKFDPVDKMDDWGIVVTNVAITKWVTSYKKRSIRIYLQDRVE